MAGNKSQYLAAKVLDSVFSNAAFPANATVYVALLTDTNTPAQRDAGIVTEVSGGAYARVAVTNNATQWPAASGTNPTQKKNANAITFPAATANWGTITAFAVYDAAAGGNLLYWGDLYGPAITSTSVASATDKITSAAHGLVNGNQVVVGSVAGLLVPGGLAAGTSYFVVGATTNDFQLSATLGGAAIDLTGTDANLGLTVSINYQQSVVTGNTPSLAGNQLVISEV